MTKIHTPKPRQKQPEAKACGVNRDDPLYWQEHCGVCGIHRRELTGRCGYCGRDPLPNPNSPQGVHPHADSSPARTSHDLAAS